MPPPSASESTITVQDILSLLRRRVVLILVVAAVITAGASVGIFLLPDVFEAKSVVHVEAAQIPDSQKKTGFHVPRLAQLVVILRQEALSRETLRDLVNELDLYELGQKGGTRPGEGDAAPATPSFDPVERARKDVRIDMVKRGQEDFVEISVRARTARLAARAVNRVADTLSAKNRALRLKQEQEAKAYLERRMTETERLLIDAETVLVRFREANHESLPDNANQLLDRLQKLRFDSGIAKERLQKAQLAMAEIQRRIDALRLAGTPGAPAAGPSEGPRRLLEERIARLTAEEEDLVRRGYGPGWPALARVQATLERAREELRAMDTGAPSEGAGASAAVGTLAPSDERLRPLLAQLGELTGVVAAIERELEYGAAETARLEMLKSSFVQTRSKLDKIEDAFEEAQKEHKSVLSDLRDIEKLIAAEQQGQTDQFRTIEAAEAPLFPVSPNRPLLLAAALAGAIGAGLGLAYVLEMTRPRYRDAQDVEADLGVDVIAVLPELPDGTSEAAPAAGEPTAPPAGRGALAAAREREAALALMDQQCNRLRHAVQNHPQVRRVRSLLVTSALPGEGKTTAASGLARAIARSLDHWALLVECDLRRPCLAPRLRLPPGPGLAGHLSDGIPLPEVIQPTDAQKLSVIPAGREILGSAELLASTHMRRVVDELVNRYPDRIVVIDAPPLLGAPEAVSLAMFVDGVVLVVQAEGTPRRIVRTASRMLPAGKLLGVALNRAHGADDHVTYQYLPMQAGATA